MDAGLSAKFSPHNATVDVVTQLVIKTATVSPTEATMGVQAMDSDEENDELLERLPWGVWRCCDETAPIYGREHGRMLETVAALGPERTGCLERRGAWVPRRGCGGALVRHVADLTVP